MADSPQVHELSTVALVLRSTDEVAVVKSPLKRGDELQWGLCRRRARDTDHGKGGGQQLLREFHLRITHVEDVGSITTVN